MSLESPDQAYTLQNVLSFFNPGLIPRELVFGGKLQSFDQRLGFLSDEIASVLPL